MRTCGPLHKTAFAIIFDALVVHTSSAALLQPHPNSPSTLAVVLVKQKEHVLALPTLYIGDLYVSWLYMFNQHNCNKPIGEQHVVLRAARKAVSN